MNTRWNNEKLKAFVKNTLGCGCPEKVFEKIDVSKLPTVVHEEDATRIVVGDTLLIYVIRPTPSADFFDSVESIGLAGKADRDANSYNRFRLVVSGIEDDGQQEKASECFLKSFNIDEKMHIHFIDKELLDGLN